MVNTIYWQGKWITKLEFERRIGRLSAFLFEAGVKIGERVAVLTQNHPILLEGIYAARKHGWLHVPLNYRLPPLELAPLLKYIEPRVLIYAKEFSTQAAQAKQQLPALQLVTLEEVEALTLIGNEKQGEASYLAPAPVGLSTDTIMLLFTGGTTGTAKAAQITREMFETNISDTISSWGLSKKDCTVIATPMFHAGVNALATPLLELGGRVAILEKFTPEGYLQMVEDCGCTHLFAVPTMFQKLIESAIFETFDFSQIKYAITGGSPCPNHVREAFRNKGVQFKLGFGMTEAGVNCFTQNLENAALKPNSVGFPMPNLKAVLRDKNGNEASMGELTLSGKQIMGGYWNKPLETAEVLRTINGQTWLFTGDIATKDSDGHYRIIGRSKDMIISGGENIYPLEIERAIYEHPSILECAVLGVPDAQWGEVALAAIVTRADVTLDTRADVTLDTQEDVTLDSQAGLTEELQRFLRTKLANYKVPKHYVFLEELPKSAAGKILKHVLQEQFIAKSRPVQNSLNHIHTPDGHSRSPQPENTLVLLHGNYASGRWWQPYLETSRFTCFAPTLPGFAGTVPLEKTSIKTMCNWLETQLQSLEQRVLPGHGKPVLLGHGKPVLLGHGKPVLLGHSLGGALALELAARDPSRYAGLILVSSPSLTGFPHNPAGDVIRAAIPQNRVLLEQIFKLQSPKLPAHTGEFWEAILDDAQALPFTIGNGFAVELGTWNRFKTAQALSSLPTLILAGQADVLVTPSQTQELAAQLPHAILETRENIGHWLPLEDPEWFATRVNTFLESL
jgi:fatty-acyl-CoA synthase